MTRLGDLSPFGRLFKVLGDNLFGPNRPNFWRLFGRFLKVGQNLKFLCYKIIFKAVNFQKKYFLKYFEKKLGNFFSKKDPKYAFLATKTSKNWVGDFGRLFSLHWAIFYSNHLVTLIGRVFIFVNGQIWKSNLARSHYWQSTNLTSTRTGTPSPSQALAPPDETFWALEVFTFFVCPRYLFFLYFCPKLIFQLWILLRIYFKDWTDFFRLKTKIFDINKRSEFYA